MQRNTTLFDIFLYVLEQQANEAIKERIRKLRILMEMPECLEFLNICLINTLGYSSPIKESHVDKGIDCLILLYENDIEGWQNAAPVRKKEEIFKMKIFMEQYRTAVKEELAKRGLLQS